MLIDEAKIYVRGGDGGNGVIAFHREAFVPYGGPSGGDGGHGGNVYLVVDKNLNTLLTFKYKSHFKATRGRHGEGGRRSGKGGDDLQVMVPPGTVVKDPDTGEVLFDLIHQGQMLLVARGGRGGRGNCNFATSINQAPQKAEKGEPGEERWVKLELKLLADVGIIGYPNAGKSTLISHVSSAKPKIADYPFTTLVPNLGVVKLTDLKTCVFADIPGLIEGAHKGSGLGFQFLKHIERTKILLHMIDLSHIDENEPLKDYNSINQELKLFSDRLSRLPQIIVPNKIDLPYGREKLGPLTEALVKLGLPVYPISAVTGEGIRELINKLAELVSEDNSDDGEVKSEISSLQRKIEKNFHIDKKGDQYIVKGDIIEKKVMMTYLDNEECVSHLQKLLSKYGIIKKLEESGVKDGDTVVIADFEFAYFKDDFSLDRLRMKKYGF